MEKKVNLSVVLRAAGDLTIEERPLPQQEVAKGEVLLGVKSVGICGSDIHFWKDGRIGDYVLCAPMVMGHEASATVVAVGDGVTHLQKGDRVAIEPGVPCRLCSLCKEGQYNLCPDVKFGSCPPIDGFLTRYVTHAADFCYKGCSYGTPECGRACLSKGEVQLGSKVLVCGAGPIGLVCMIAAKAFGASQVLITDIDEGRLRVAKEMGATYTLKVTSSQDSRALAKEVESVLGCKPDRSIECSGVEPSIATAIYATRSGGVLVLVGLGAPEAKIPIVDASVREVDIRGVFRYSSGCYPAALEMVASGRVNVKPLITHRYSLEDALQAFQRAKTGEGGAIKVMIRCSAEE